MPRRTQVTTIADVAASAAKIVAVHRAVDNAEVGIVFQPICDLRTEAVFGYEALARPKSAEFSITASTTREP